MSPFDIATVRCCACCSLWPLNPLASRVNPPLAQRYDSCAIFRSEQCRYATLRSRLRRQCQLTAPSERKATKERNCGSRQGRSPVSCCVCGSASDSARNFSAEDNNEHSPDAKIQSIPSFTRFDLSELKGAHRWYRALNCGSKAPGRSRAEPERRLASDPRMRRREE